MTNTQHTPAPWRLTFSGMCSTPDWQVSKNDVLICNLAETNTRNAQTVRANARLIAAAPELFADFERAIELLKQVYGADALIKDGEELIARIKGEAQQ